ncbi:hypothetical protein OSSY52_08610 [Tepiditoga spiralis]|uniref:Lipoprotein n=1 Tax=Tepiditoga spiralis TaxID=2108365 RepID=A0A7G1G2U4_9BACT|nr:hypothetical protein [Tepiditoga spiralis]BBE30720.1 hypothetical protein OSSY52_08610 [Tepiditoga spiralis]
MKKVLTLSVLVVAILMVFTGCLPKTKFGTATLKTIPELRTLIMNNKDTWTDFDAKDRLYETEGTVAYEYVSNSDSTKNYVYVVDDKGNGIKLSYLHKNEYENLFNVNDKIKIKGVPYYKTWDDPNVYELRMDISNYGTITVLEANHGIVLSSAKNQTSSLTGSNFANLIKFTGKYVDSDQFQNKNFTLANGDTIVIDSHSTIGTLTPNSTYTVTGVVGQSFGYRVFTSDASWTTLLEAAPPAPTPESTYTGIEKVKNDFLTNSASNTFKNIEGKLFI